MLKKVILNSKYRFYFIFSLILICDVLNCSSQNAPHFNHTYSKEAIWDLPYVIPNHPRIFLRPNPWLHGSSLKELRQWRKLEPWKAWLKKKPLGKPMENWALRYLLTEDESLVPPIISFLKKQKYWPGTLTMVATCYDWIFNSPSFSEKDKKEIEKKMCQMAEKAIKKGEYYKDMWSHYGYRPVTDIIMAGLALYGRRPEAKKYLALGGGYLKRNFLPGWQLTGGAWMGGWTYYKYSGIYLIKAIAAWSSATDEDFFTEIKKRYGNWLEGHMYYLMQTVFPDNTPVDTCGFSYCPYRPGANFSLLLIATAYKNKDGIKFLKDHYGNLDQWWWHGWPYLFYSPELRKMKIDAYKMPLSKCWGRNGVGYVQMRSGWGKGDTIIEFKCGDYFWSHQFHNQNAFYIYRKGRLAIQSGIYDSYWGDHMQFYYRPTISSNNILVIDPKEKSWIPLHVARNYGVRTQNGFFKEFGGQRACYILPQLGSAENCFTFKKYLWRKNHEHHFETGDIEAYEYTKDYTYVCGNATKAYNNPWFSYPGNEPKLDLFTRQLVFLDKKYLLVFDRVRSLNPEYEKRWLLHSITEPKINGEIIKEEYPGHRMIYKPGLITILEGKGKLYCQTLLPQKAIIRKAGGAATISEVKRDSKNRGNIYLKPQIKGKYWRLSPTIATDCARVEDWEIEFQDETHFKLYGSKTGYDGQGDIKKNFLSKSRSIFIPKQNWQGKAKRGDKLYFSVTSASNRFWVDGRNHIPDLKKVIAILRDGSHINPGYWRIEIIPTEKKKLDVFLHLLYPCDVTDLPVEGEIIVDDEKVIGMRVKNWVVLFSKTGSHVKQAKLEIKETGLHKNLLVDLEKEKQYKIKFYSNSGETKQILRKSSREGTIYFETTHPCKVVIQKEE